MECLNETEAAREANRRYAQTYYWVNHDKVLEQARAKMSRYYEKNKDAVKERMRAYRARLKQAKLSA
jgi:hypothetical protein